MKIDTLAAIDIGSNAIRLLINNIERYPSDKEFKKVAFIRVPIRLGEDVFTQKRVSDLKKERLIEAMHGFFHIMKAFNVINYRACATSAMREAQNGKEIVEEIFLQSGIRIDIISGDEEAETIYHAGGLDSVMDPSKNYLYVDVGGGSTEIVVYGSGEKITSRSFKLGTVRMIENAVEQSEMEHFKDWLKKISKKYAPQGIIASGGNINKIHKMLSKREKDTLNSKEMAELYDTLSKMSYEERIHDLKLNTYRADVIIPALLIFLTVSKSCKIEEVIVPKVGLVDGLIHQLYDKLYNGSDAILG